jgi:hypothetical protein
VKESPDFKKDPLFTLNPDGAEESDVGHRDRANYADNIGNFPNFRPLDAVTLKNRVDRISQTNIITPPIPRKSRFPDTDNVQIVAYRRLVKFRDVLDEILGSKNRYWNGNRTPTWANILNFQLAEPTTLASFIN